ncbi:MAG: hypothetical protein GY778_30950 [bacterium]|nr:hypothetical protein [bacterium]
MNRTRVATIAWLTGCVLAAQPVVAGGDHSSLVATITTSNRYVQPGASVWVDFTITNTSDHTVELAVPETKTSPANGSVGLPIAHVFSGAGFSGLSIASEHGQSWNAAIGYQPPASSETLLLRPHASVGIGVEVTQYYRVLRNPGRFRLRWSPYGGVLASNELVLEVATPKQALIQTDQGNMTLRFFYDDAPAHVANFIELARSGFYDNLNFHRLIPGYYIQGGCPNGDGTGIRADGFKLEAEFSERPIRRGAVCMARLEDDPNSASTQFLICNTRVPAWDGRYTVFGELLGDESFATLEKLMNTPTEPNGRPKQRLYTRAIRIVDAPSGPPVPPGP